MVAGDVAAVQIEGAEHHHAAASLLGFVRDRTGRAAVGEGEGFALVHLNNINTCCSRRDAVAVEAEHHAVLRMPGFTHFDIFHEVVVAARPQTGYTHGTCPSHIIVILVIRTACAADGVLVSARRQCRRLAEPGGQCLQLLRVFQLCLLSLGQGFIIRVAGGLKRLVDRHGIRIVHAVQFRRVRQSVDHRLHGGHGLLCGRVLLLFFLLRRLALLLRFRRLALLLRGRRLVFLLRFPVCRVCRFLHGRGRLRRPLRLRRQRRRGQQRQAQGQRHETAQDTLLHRSPPVRFLLCPNQSPADRDLPVGSPPYGSGGAPGQFFSFRRSV